jgi:RNA polymerase sigma factor (sigma-70 family)
MNDAKGMTLMASAQNILAERFAAERPRLVALAARVLDSRAEAEEVVQDAWLRLHAADTEAISNLGGWLSTVVARAAIDRLRQRRRRGETPLEDNGGRTINIADPAPGPEDEAVLADAIGMALLIVLDRLAPAERLAFVLHDLFGLSFDEVSTVVGRSPTAARQLASRARRRVRAPAGSASASVAARAELVAAFAKASREGQMEDMLRILDPDVTLTLNTSGLPPGISGVVRGAARIALRALAGRAAALERDGEQSVMAEVMLVDGAPGLVFAPDGKVERIIAFAIVADLISAIEVITDPGRLARAELCVMGWHRTGQRQAKESTGERHAAHN